MIDRRLHALLTVTLLVLLAGSASAHSFDRNFASARYALDLDAEALHVLVVVEMPTLDVLGDFRRYLRDHPEASDEENTEAFRLQQLQDLSDSFFLSVDGAAIEGAWTAVDSPANGLGDADFFVYMIEHKTASPGGERMAVELVNRMQPAKVVYMSNRADAADGWLVESDSTAPILAEGLDGEVVGPDIASDQASAKWSTNEAMRELSVVFARANGTR